MTRAPAGAAVVSPAPVGGVSAVLGAGSPPRASERSSDALYVWGVDPSSRKLAVAWDGPGCGVEKRLFTYPVEQGGERLADIYDVTLEMASELAARVPPLYVFVEDTNVYSKFAETISWEAAGVIQAALWTALRGVFEFPVKVGKVSTAQWKKFALGAGRGHAKKHEVLAWARSAGYEGSDQDEADAWAIAAAGRKLLEPAPEQLKLA